MENSRPLTKNDLIEALQVFKIELGNEFRNEFKPFRDEFQAKTNEIAKNVARLDGDMHEVRYMLSTQVATKQDLERVMRFADQNLREMDEHRELQSARGARLDEVAGKVEDHERRLREIEGRN